MPREHFCCKHVQKNWGRKNEGFFLQTLLAFFTKMDDHTEVFTITLPLVLTQKLSFQADYLMIVAIHCAFIEFDRKTKNDDGAFNGYIFIIFECVNLLLMI